MSKPTIVIVPGSWQNAAAWNTFITCLNAAGYTTEFVALPTIGGTEAPLAGLVEDIAAVKAILAKVVGSGKQPLLLCHSSGGVSGSNSVSGFDVAGIIYLSGFMIPKGKSLLDMLGGQPLPWMKFEGDRVSGITEMLPQVAFNDLDPESQARWSKEMSHTSAVFFSAPSCVEPWNDGVPCAYIYSELDNALPLPIQQQMAEQLGPLSVTVSIKAGHCPHLSMPNELVATVQVIESQLGNIHRSLV